MSTVQEQPYLTRTGRERLREELNKLLQQRESVDARMREEMQDKDDDFSRYLTHEELAQLNARITSIERILEQAEEAEEPAVVDGLVGIGSSVTVRDEAGKEQRFTIVTPVESDPGRGFISFTSPVGSALLGKATGDRVTAPAPRGERELTVISVN